MLAAALDPRQLLVGCHSGIYSLSLAAVPVQVSTTLTRIVRTMLGLNADAVPEVAGALQRLDSRLQHNQLELLQRHVWTTLGPGSGEQQPKGDAAASEAAQVTQLLMSDWITLHVRNPQLLRADELMPLAAHVYTRAGELAVGAALL